MKKATQAAKKSTPSWVSPVKSYKLSASFAQNGGMWAHKHSGQDYAVPTGTPVMAAHGGTVVKVRRQRRRTTARRTATPS